jgi:hypothetical protein
MIRAGSRNRSGSAHKRTAFNRPEDPSLNVGPLPQIAEDQKLYHRWEDYCAGRKREIFFPALHIVRLTGLLQLATFSFRTIKYWSGLAGDFESASSKCSAKNGKKVCFILLKS